MKNFLFYSTIKCGWLLIWCLILFACYGLKDLVLKKLIWLMHNELLKLILRSLMYYSNSSWSNLLIERGKKGESLGSIFGTLFYTMGGEKSRLWNFCTAIHVHYYWNYKKLCYYKSDYHATFSIFLFPLNLSFIVLFTVSSKSPSQQNSFCHMTIYVIKNHNNIASQCWLILLSDF